MAENSKLKVLYILEIMKKTDENHPINTTQLVNQLKKYGIIAERKSVSRDIKCLESAGFSIVKCENHNEGWYMIDQDFEEYQLKMLADCVAAAKFLTIEDSRELLKKIKKLATKDGEKFIDATVVMDPAIKLIDKKFKTKFDTIMRAITAQKMISFQYEDIVEGNKRRPRKDGMVYRVSPYFLTMWGPEYFMICNVPSYTNAAPYRVEMMVNIKILDDSIRPMCEIEKLKDIGMSGYTMADYIRENVHLWGGESHRVTISGINFVRQDVMKKFGNDLMFLDQGKDRFSVIIKAAGTEGLYQWMAKYGANLRIESPKEDVDGYVKYLQNVLAQYE